ncbi:hypothetical protein ACMBCM_09750 [Spiroplasma sp. K1]
MCNWVCIWSNTWRFGMLYIYIYIYILINYCFEKWGIQQICFGIHSVQLIK